MQSLVPGYQYDIFISYRQKDNKYDGWITEFVSNLKKELEATFKEDISVYFDINPHDGLLETHDVDASLKEKLKCLVFIPIISRTYCDPKSFAWEREFKAFVEQASQDQFGLKIKVPNGNVATRVLPVRIHDLDSDDIKLCESLLGGVLRGIEFIYKESGFNRPLKPDDDEKINLNKTKYRNQITKVTLAVKEIISGLKTGTGRKETDSSKTASVERLTEDSGGVKVKNRLTGINLKKWLLIFVATMLCVAGSFAVYKFISHVKQSNLSKLDKSIAVLPFVNDSPDKENEYFCNGMMDEILNQLQKIGDLTVKARTSVEKYRNTDKDIKVIGKELGAAYVMEGSVRKVGEDVRITAQLIDAKTGNHLWSETYDWKYTSEIFKYQSSVAKKVAISLNAVITPDEKARIDSKPTKEMRAYDLSMRATDLLTSSIWKDDSTFTKNSKIALNLYNQALKIDPFYVQAFLGKAGLFSWLRKFDSAMIYYKKVLEIDPLNSRAWMGIGLAYVLSNHPDSAYFYYKKGLDNGANETWDYMQIGQYFLYNKNNLIEALRYFQKAFISNGDKSAGLEHEFSHLFDMAGDYQRGLEYYYKGLSNSSECYFLYEYNYLLCNQGKYNEALQFLDSACSVNSCESYCLASKFYIYTIQKDFDKAEQYYKIYQNAENKDFFEDTTALVYLAFLYKETNRKKEAFSILNGVIKNDEKKLKSEEGWGFILRKWRLTAAYAIMDENTKALQYLSELGISGLYQAYFSLKTFPGFDNLRNDPEFKAIVKRIDDKNATLRKEIEEMRKRGEITL
jgi:TolB-like protein